MEYRHGSIGIFVHPHRDRHIMKPVRVLRDLQVRAVLVDGVVLGHDPRLLHTQDFGEGGSDPRDAGGARLRGPHHTPSMMLRENVLGQRPVGRRPLGDPGVGEDEDNITLAGLSEKGGGERGLENLAASHVVK